MNYYINLNQHKFKIMTPSKNVQLYTNAYFSFVFFRCFFREKYRLNLILSGIDLKCLKIMGSIIWCPPKKHRNLPNYCRIQSFKLIICRIQAKLSSQNPQINLKTLNYLPYLAAFSTSYCSFILKPLDVISPQIRFDWEKFQGRRLT